MWGRAGEIGKHWKREGQMTGQRGKRSKEGPAWMINFRKCLKPWSAHPCRCFVAALSCVPPPRPNCVIQLVCSSGPWLISLGDQQNGWPSLTLSFPPSCSFRRPVRPAGGKLFFSPFYLCFSSVSLFSLVPYFSSSLLSFPFYLII